MKKSLITILATSVILLSFMGQLFMIQSVQASDPTSWYTTTKGVLDTDYYILYPFEKNSVDFGFSKFGELLGIPTGLDQNVQANWIGMEYDVRDPFAPDDIVPMTSWINGWYMDINYIDPALTGVKKDRHLFAFAMFADGFAWGGDWQTVTTPQGEPHGGRKTNGKCTTEDLKILYDGPRRFVAQSVTHISDKDGTTTWPVLDLIITMIFDKVMKQTILLKDVKITMPKMHIWGKLNVQLSNREEYDLGTNPTYAGYAHFYEQEGNACFTPDWHMADDLTRDRVEHHAGNGVTKIFALDAIGMGYPIAQDFMKVYVDGAFIDPSISPSPYTVDWVAGTVTFKTAPASYADIVFNYKYIFKVAETGTAVPTWAHKYDIAQMIADDGLYVSWTAMWPPVSDYTVDGILRFLEPLVEVSETDMSHEPKQSPLVIGEWDFLLDHASLPMFRAVEVKGTANRHDADDEQYGGYNIIDTEAYYQLDTVFLAWDLESAVHKSTQRWVQFYDITAQDWQYAQSYHYDLYIPLDHKPVLYASWWEQYSSFSERVLWDGSLKYPARQYGTIGFDWQYELIVYGDGYGYIWIPYIEVPIEDTRIKILYSTDTEYTNYDHIAFARNETQVTRTWASNFWYTLPIWGDTSFEDWLGVGHEFMIDYADFKITNTTNLVNGATCTLSGTMDWWAEDIKVFKENIAVIKVYWLSDWEDSNAANGINMIFDGFEMTWAITPRLMEDTHIDWAHLDMDYVITATYNATSDKYNLTISFDVNGDGLMNNQLYTEHTPGRYEWGIVGRDAASVDSAGLSMVSAAFKNKQVEYGLAGADMYDPEIANQMPWVMTKIGTGDTYQNYYYSGTDYRTALRDHWCTDMWTLTPSIEPVAIASSNMIGVGGPIADLLAYYGNDFTDAFYGLDQFTGYSTWENKIVPLTCWNGTKRSYASSDTTGYAVVSTYLDLNGTALFLIWGHWGRDTYYASKWFHEDGIYEFQDFPSCATSIILKITYKSTDEGYKPTAYKVVEVLGTISETTVYDGSIVKGGIHDP